MVMIAVGLAIWRICPGFSTTQVFGAEYSNLLVVEQDEATIIRQLVYVICILMDALVDAVNSTFVTSDDAARHARTRLNGALSLEGRTPGSFLAIEFLEPFGLSML